MQKQCEVVLIDRIRLCGFRTGRQGLKWGLDQCLVTVTMGNQVNIKIQMGHQGSPEYT